MRYHLTRRWVALLALLSIMLSGVVGPAPIRTATAATEPGDELLVRPAIKNPNQDRVFYFVLPDRFSNGVPANDTGGLGTGSADADVLKHGFKPSDKGYYHGGDFKGLQNKLDYLAALGVNAIWMTPVFQNKAVQGDGTIAGSSAAYHGYWITDFTKVDSHLGTNQELKDLISAAQSRGMKVFFDIITNHTADVIQYEGGDSTYRSKADAPYKDAGGQAFDDTLYAGTNFFPSLNLNSFPYKPIVPAAEANVKKPDWLNNPIYYHNRGNSSFSGENSNYGDFFGLDDLFTEHPKVVDGMIDIYKYWIKEFGIDGFRIDTVKHVNIEFWQKFSPEIEAYAKANGKPEFFMYGEVFDSNPAFKSQYTTVGKLPATLDFGFQGTATSFASSNSPTDGLRDFFANDDYYTDADSNAYSLPTFLGNHDMGRFGRFVQTNPNNNGASASELLNRARLGHALMFFARGMPVIYYGDEQGFTGDGGDKDARQNMFASQVPSYNDDVLIGSNKTTATDSYDTSHPLFTLIKQLSDLRKNHVALRDGVQVHRYSSDQAGLYAFSRIDRSERVEYVVVLNNAEQAKSATFSTFLANGNYTQIFPAGGANVSSNANKELTVNVPALGYVVYRANSAVPASSAAPAISISSPSEPTVNGRVEVAANVDSDGLNEVTFAVKLNDGAYQVIGTDTNAPYRVFYDTSKLPNGTKLTFKAIVNDLNNNLASAKVERTVKIKTEIGPSECPPVKYAIIHYHRPAGDYGDYTSNDFNNFWGLHLFGDAIADEEVTQWTTPKKPNGEDEFGVFWFVKLKDPSKPVRYIVHKGDTKDGTEENREFAPSVTPEIWIKANSATNFTSAAAALGYITIHYNRPDAQYAGWGTYLFNKEGSPLGAGEATPGWPGNRQFIDASAGDKVGTTSFGVYRRVTVNPNDLKGTIGLIITKPNQANTDAEKDPNNAPDRLVIPANAASVWVKSGDEKTYTSRAAAENKAVIHYHRPAGDYGNYTSNNSNDFWGLHVWTGAQTPTEWATPIKSARTDKFGVVFEVPLEAGATKLNYIVHKGDAKDLPDNQELVFANSGQEVWIIQSTVDYLLPTKVCVAGCTVNYDYAVIHYHRPAGDYGNYSSTDFNNFWGLHLFGDAVDNSEVTLWDKPKKPNGQDEFGVFWFVKLKDSSKPLKYIVHKGETKDGTNLNREFTPNETPEIWIKANDAANYTTAAAALGYVTIYYNRPDNTYDGWGAYLFNKEGTPLDAGETTTWPTNRPFIDAGAGDKVGEVNGWRYRRITINPAQVAGTVGLIITKPNAGNTDAEKDPAGATDRLMIPANTASVWVKSGDAKTYTSRAAAENKAVIHYHRPAGDYGDYSSTNYQNFWGLHVWTGSQNPTEWAQPIKPARSDYFGQVFEVPLEAGATKLNYILHKGDAKDQSENQELVFAKSGQEVWIIQERADYLVPFAKQCQTNANKGDLSKARAHWVARDTLAMPIAGGAANRYVLYYDPTGAIKLDDALKVTGGVSLTLAYNPAGLSATQREKFPHLAGLTALQVSAADLAKVPNILKGQIVVAAFDANGAQVDATNVQIPGVLDDLYTTDTALGVNFDSTAGLAQTTPTVRVWAPTARSVKLLLYDTPTGGTATTNPMVRDDATGVWSATGQPDWVGKYFLYEIEVYVPSTGKVETNLVTDPYSISLSMNSKRSQIVNLAATTLKPTGWDMTMKPKLDAPEDIVLYELHVRDFSIYDTAVPEAQRGTYAAFASPTSTGMKHLKTLAKAGLTHIHLLPSSDCASINEDKSQRKEADQDALAAAAPDSEVQAGLVDAIRDEDGFNWCYDPYHFNVPEGSYSTNPTDTVRILEYRQMVQALNMAGLRVVMDVVYNHTAQAGQGEKSVFDKVVPGYYHRLNNEGKIETSTCCQNTASEHAMMEKFLIDSVLLWAKAYKVDGFRFDLMGHHMKSNMVKLRAELDKLTIAKDGVDGKAINLYGEGWNFGEVQDSRRGVNATQLNLPGTGIGTFSDRLRDAVRGGGPFDGGENKKIQGFINGLYYDPNALAQGDAAAQKGRLLLYQDQIKVGLVGNLANYRLMDRSGAMVSGAQVDYNGSPAGYTLDPQEVVTYIEAHDNETLFDKIQYAAPISATIPTRVRMHNLGNSIVMLSQGTPFFQAGQDMLRSKSLDRNSYNAGDWFNRLDWTFTTNNWGIGLPPGENTGTWPVMKPLLANPALKPTKTDILSATVHFQEMLRIRKSSPLFRLQTAEAVQQQVSFLNNGPDQIPGVIAMVLTDTRSLRIDNPFTRIVVVFNASDEEQTISAESLKNGKLRLHPVQQSSADPVVRSASYNATTGSLKVPARTTVVFVEAAYQTVFPIIRR
jgi:pullulanase-type alpha-1,6-glucosidase